MDNKENIFLEAYKNCHKAFVQYCSALSYGKMDTEDLVQDVLLSAFQHFDKIQKKDQLLHYLIRAARFKSISNWRKKKYKQELLEQHADRLLSQDVSADTLLDIQLLYKTMDRLPEKQKDALILFEITGFSMREIAELHNTTEGAVKTKVSRARKSLKEMLEENELLSSNLQGTLKTFIL